MLMPKYWILDVINVKSAIEQIKHNPYKVMVKPILNTVVRSGIFLCIDLSQYIVPMPTEEHVVYAMYANVRSYQLPVLISHLISQSVLLSNSIYLLRYQTTNLQIERRVDNEPPQ